MNREGMPRKDVKAVKEESPTVVSSMEDAETVLTAESETVKSDGETVEVLVDASLVGTPENPKNLDSGKMYEEEGEVTEKIDMKARELREDERGEDLEQVTAEAAMEADEDTVLRKASILTSADAFNLLVSRAEEVGMPDLAGISHTQYSEMVSRKAEVQKELDSAGFFKKMFMFGKGSLKAEMRQLDSRMDAFDRLNTQVELRNESDINPAAATGNNLRGTAGTRSRTARNTKAGKGGFGKGR